jgi:hypothetical protein
LTNDYHQQACEPAANLAKISREASMIPTSAPDPLRCPFVYATGHQCTGTIYRAAAYGGHGGEVKKYRLWCSDKDDHAGAVTSPWAKQRMEFYPDHMRAGLIDHLTNAGMVE